MEDLMELGGSKLERLITDLFEVADNFYKEREEAMQALTQKETQMNALQTSLERSKQEQQDSKEALASKEKAAREEQAALRLELETLKTCNEELKAKMESFRFQNEQLVLAQTNGSGKEQANSNSHPQQQQAHNRISNLVTKEVVEQLNAVHDALKTMEARVAIAGASTKQADLRVTEMGKNVEQSTALLLKAKKELVSLQLQVREANFRARNDAATISSLRLDVEVLQEQANSLREQVASLGQGRRRLEAELEKTKLALATSLLPIMEGPPPSAAQPETDASVCNSMPTSIVLFQGGGDSSDRHHKVVIGSLD